MFFFFFSSRRRHTRCGRDWSSDVCSSDLWQSATGVNQFGYRSYNGTTERTLFAAADRLATNTSTPSWVCKMLTLAGIDTQAELDALSMEVGYSGDVSPVPGIHAIYVELAVKEDITVQITANDSATATDVLGVNAAITLSDSATGTDYLPPFNPTASDSATASEFVNLSRTIFDSATATDVAAGGLNQAKTLSDSATATDVGTAYLPPITITVGGTYSGNWGSTDQTIPAVTISTTQPVRITRSKILHAGRGINDTVTGTNLTIDNTDFLRVKPATTTIGDDGRAINLDAPASLIVEHNDLRYGNGIVVGTAGTCSPMRIRYNRCRDVGYYPPSDCCIQFVQLAQQTCPGGEISWNHTTNYHTQSKVEDNINLYNTSGQSGLLLEIHHNLIDGAYDASAGGGGYTGGGILCGDNGGSFVRIRNNTVVSTTNYGVGITGGTDNTLDNNFCVNDAFDQAGVIHGPTYAVGVSVHDDLNTGTMARIVVTNNQIGWNQKTGVGNNTARNDFFVPAATTFTGNTSLADPINAVSEQAARDAWEATRQAAGIIVGITPAGQTIAFGSDSASGNFNGTSAVIDITSAPDFAWVYVGIFIAATQGGANKVALSSWTRLLDNDESTTSHYALIKYQKQPGDTTFTVSWPTTGHGAWAWSSYTGQDPDAQEEQIGYATGVDPDYNKLIGYYYSTGEYAQLTDIVSLPLG